MFFIQALTRFSDQLTKNSQLRKELQTLHIERVRFQQLQNRLDKVRGHTMGDSQTRQQTSAFVLVI